MQVIRVSHRRSLTRSIDSLSRQATAVLITGYQTHLSPRKGFSCAYRVLHRSESCSQYAKRTILECGIQQAMPLIRQRFQACKLANQTLKASIQRHRTKQQELAVARSPALSLHYRNASALAEQPWIVRQNDALDGADESEPIEPPDETTEPGVTQPKRRGGFGGGSFRKPPVAGSEATNTTNSNTNCSDWNCDALDCVSLSCDAIDCSSADFSGMDCSGADCNGADCSSLDCSSLDCSSCDFGSCDCSV